MLLILYGAASELGRKCRDHIQSKGYEIVDKYSYAEEKPIFESRYGKRVYLTRDEFYKKTDSLFRYNVSNFQVGFNWEQISDAVYEGKNKLLTCTSADVGMLRKIKEVFEGHVKIIYFYIDTSALEGLFINLPNMTLEEYGSRMATGLAVKECYSQNADLFDSVVIYGGESSLFNYATVFKQIDDIISQQKKPEKDNEEKYDVLLSYCITNINEEKKNKQYCFIKELAFSLDYYGINVFQNSVGSLIGDNDTWKIKIEEIINRSKVFVPVFSEDALNSEYFLDELNVAISAAKNNGVVILPISLDKHDKNSFLDQYSAYNVSSENYMGSINFIEDWFVDMFSGEKTLLALSEKIEQCIDSKLYKKAFELHGNYISILRNHLSRWHKKGTVEKIKAQIKHLQISLDAAMYSESKKIVCNIVAEITDELDYSFSDMIIDSIVDYCNKAEVDSDYIRELIKKNLAVSEELKIRYIEKFSSKYSLASKKNRKSQMDRDMVDIADKIANYSKASVDLFEALFEKGVAIGYRDTLVSAYRRILDYCRSIDLNIDSVTEKCIDRISELKEGDLVQNDDTDRGKKTLQSLKVYLGQALPETGNYDVFISHKSVDDLIADKVYEHLKLCGYEVFCDHHTLGELRDSNYDKRVMEALSKSKHLILVSSSPDYIKDGWVHDEWHHFHSDKRDKYRNGNLIMILSDNLLPRKSELPIELRDGYEIIKTSEFRDKINNYLW